MALTGYYKTLIRPRTHRPLSMLKYDPVGTSLTSFSGVGLGGSSLEIPWWKRHREQVLDVQAARRGAAELAVVQSLKTSGITRRMQLEKFKLTLVGCSAEKGSFLGTEAWWTITSGILFI